MIGKEIAHYRIEAKLGEGGMGEVYRARDTKLRPAILSAVEFGPELGFPAETSLSQLIFFGFYIATLSRPITSIKERYES